MSGITEELDMSTRTGLGGSTPGRRSRANTDPASDTSGAPVPQPRRGGYIKVQNNSEFIVDVEIKWRNRPRRVGGIRRRRCLAWLGFRPINVGGGVGGGVEGGVDEEERYTYEDSNVLIRKLEPKMNGTIGGSVICEKPRGCNELYVLLKARIEPRGRTVTFRKQTYDMTDGSYVTKVSDAEVSTFFTSKSLHRLAITRKRLAQVFQGTFKGAFTRREDTIRVPRRWGLCMPPTLCCWKVTTSVE